VVLEHLFSADHKFSFEMMEIREFKDLREKVRELIRSNHSLRQERKDFTEKLLSRDRQIQELKERCDRYERNRSEAHQRVSSILGQIERLKP
jgi:chromosome segregation ATPase